MIADWSRGTRGITCFHLAVAGRLAYVPPTGPELGPILCFTSGGNLLLLVLSFPSSTARRFFRPTNLPGFIFIIRGVRGERWKILAQHCCCYARQPSLAAYLILVGGRVYASYYCRYWNRIIIQGKNNSLLKYGM